MGVGSMDEPYQILDILSGIDCIDRERTRAQAVVLDDPDLVKDEYSLHSH